MLLAVAIFAAALVVIATERVDRTKVALVGAMLVVLSQTIDQEHAIESVDWETIGLLAGMMLIVKVTEPTGIYTFLAIRAGQLLAGGRWPSSCRWRCRRRCCRRSSTTSRRSC